MGDKIRQDILGHGSAQMTSGVDTRTKANLPPHHAAIEALERAISGP
jgi:hypothetical protein